MFQKLSNFIAIIFAQLKKSTYKIFSQITQKNILLTILIKTCINQKKLLKPKPKIQNSTPKHPST